MKKKSFRVLFAASLVCAMISFNAKAQIEEGSKIIGGTFQLHFEEGNNQFVITPDFAYAINENLTIGGKLGITYYQITDGDVNPAAGIYARKHFFLNDNFAFFGEAFAEYLPNFASDFRAGVLPGLTYFLDEKVAVEWAFGGIVYSTGDGDDQFDVSFSPASNSRFGIKYYFK